MDIFRGLSAKCHIENETYVMGCRRINRICEKYKGAQYSKSANPESCGLLHDLYNAERTLE